MVEIDSLLVVNSIFSANSCSALDFVSVFECWHIFLEKYILIWLLREWYLHFEDSGDRYFQKCSSFVFQHRLYLFDLFGLDWVRAGWCAWAGLWSFYSQYILCLENEFFFFTLTRGWIWTTLLKTDHVFFSGVLKSCLNTVYLWKVLLLEDVDPCYLEEIFTAHIKEDCLYLWLKYSASNEKIWPIYLWKIFAVLYKESF